MKNPIFTCMLAMLLLLPTTLMAAPQDTLDYSSFSLLPVLHDGRIKPMQSVARIMYKRVTGEAPASQTEAVAWLAHLMFAPQAAMNDPMFAITLPELPQILALPVTSDKRFRFLDIASAFAQRPELLNELRLKNPKDYTQQEQALIALYGTMNDVADVVGTFSLLAPIQDLNQGILHSLGMENNPSPDYLALQKVRKELDDRVARIMGSKHNQPNKYTPSERHIVELSSRLILLEQLNKNNVLMRVMVPVWGDKEEWLSPWAVINRGQGAPQSTAMFAKWKSLMVAYQQHDATQWQRVSQELLTAGMRGKGVSSWTLTLEAFYNNAGLLNLALACYGLGFILALIGMMRHAARLLTVSYAMQTLGVGLHIAALLMRMAILMRPPVSTLYESMIFVSMVAVAGGVWLERKRRGADGLLISSVIGSLLLVSANTFAGTSDTLEVLVAVLNTNFWLGTHVVCITSGYGAALLGGTLAHLYLLKRAFGTADEQALQQLHRRLYIISLVALLLTSVGTMLGGIWADQSWGRFWGWDPKENGALWIVLWLIWLLHARIAGQLNHLGFAVCLALLNIVVALAWVGVNLLSVGLHSYGFTNAAAQGMVVFCSVELALVAIAGGVILRRERCTAS